MNFLLFFRHPYNFPKIAPQIDHVITYANAIPKFQIQEEGKEFKIVPYFRYQRIELPIKRVKGKENGVNNQRLWETKEGTGSLQSAKRNKKEDITGRR